MADQIKQISIGTYTIGALSNGVPIASTDADTQYVVKDIQVQNNQLTSVGSSLDFVVNNVNVADIDASVSGSEIIDVSSTAVARATASFANEAFQVLMPSSSSNSKINTFSRRLVNGILAYTAPVTQTAAITTGLSSGANIVGYATIGSNFFYWTHDGNSSQALYRRVGGINGTEETVANIGSYQPVVFNGVDRFYWVTTSTIRTYNAATNTHSSVNLQTGSTGWNDINYSYPRISFANGLVFWTSNSNGGEASQTGCYAINPTTGGMIRIYNSVGPINSPISTETVFEVFYSNSTYYIVSTENTGISRDIFVRTTADFGPLTSGGTTTSAVNSVYSGTDVYTAELTIALNWPTADRTGNKLYFMTSETNPAGYSYVYKNFNPVTQTFGSSITLNLSGISPNTTDASTVKLSGYTLSDDSANKLNTTFYPQTATLRVTGVETTL